jgi:hypothetical protein
MENIKQQLQSINISDPLHFQNLTLFAIKGSNNTSFHYITLSQAYENKVVEVKETSEEGSVSELLFINNSDTPILIIEGQELLGAKQNRIINVSILVPAHISMVIPVSCCERSRWGFRSNREFSLSDRMTFSKARRNKMRSVNERWESGDTADSDQQKVWQDMDVKFAKMNVNSSTDSMGDFYDTYSERINQYVKSFASENDDKGIIAAINGKIVSMEFFDRNTSFKDNLSKIIRGLAADAIEEQKTSLIATKKQAEDFVENVHASRINELGSIGLGSQYKINGDAQLGQTLIFNNQIVHFIVFTKNEWVH